MSASAIPGESRSSKIHVEMMKKTLINSVSPDLWHPRASRLQDLTVVQQYVYHMTLRNVYEFKKQLVKSGLVCSRTLSMCINKWRNCLHACDCAIGQHFDQFYCSQLKNEKIG